MLLLATAVAENFNPSTWDDKALYSLFLVGAVPSYVMQLLEITIACTLLARRYRVQKYVNYLRYTFLAQAVAGGVALFIDYNHFPDSLPMTVVSTAYAIVWYFYFSDSCRVDWVLAHNDREWNYEAFRPTKSQVRR